MWEQGSLHHIYNDIMTQKKSLLNLFIFSSQWTISVNDKRPFIPLPTHSFYTNENTRVLVVHRCIGADEVLKLL